MKDAVYYQIELTLHDGVWYASSRAWNDEGDDELVHGTHHPGEDRLTLDDTCIERMVAWAESLHEYRRR